MIQKTCSSLDLCTLYVESLSINELLKFIEFASIVFKSDIFEINLAVVSFLKAFCGKNLSRNNKELDSLTSAIAQLLSDVMQSKNYIIRFEAFNLYFRLAESTPHPEIVKKTVMKCPALVPSIKSYAEMIPTNGFVKEEIRYEMYQKQLAEYQVNNAFREHFSDESKKILSDLFT
nr:uncharacterized protein LOC122269021 [Parasteatoda tepidariorum]